MDPHLKRCLYERQVILFFFFVIVLYSSVERIFSFSSFLFISDQCETCCSSACFCCSLLLNGFIFLPKRNPIHSINSLHELATTAWSKSNLFLPSPERLFRIWIFLGNYPGKVFGYVTYLLGVSSIKTTREKKSLKWNVVSVAPFFFLLK